MLRGEDRLYDADINLYQAKMCLHYLEQYAKSADDCPRKSQYQSKYLRHVINIDPRLRNHDLSADFELVKSTLQELVALLHP